MSARLLLWMLIMAWVGFFIVGKGSLGVTVSGGVLGAGMGLGHLGSCFHAGRSGDTFLRALCCDTRAACPEHGLAHPLGRSVPAH